MLQNFRKTCSEFARLNALPPVGEVGMLRKAVFNDRVVDPILESRGPREYAFDARGIVRDHTDWG